MSVSTFLQAAPCRLSCHNEEFSCRMTIGAPMTGAQCCSYLGNSVLLRFVRCFLSENAICSPLKGLRQFTGLLRREDRRQTKGAMH